MKSIIILNQYNIEALIEQGAELEFKFRERQGLTLDFNRPFDGVDTYDVKIDNKYKATYSVRWKSDINGRKYLDKIF